MADLALCLARKARNRGWKFIWRDCVKWNVARAAIGDERAPPRCADDGERRAARVRAALCAARQMNLERRIEIRRGRFGNARRDGACRNMRGGANRGAGAGKDMPARVVGTDDEAKLVGNGGE